MQEPRTHIAVAGALAVLLGLGGCSLLVDASDYEGGRDASARDAGADAGTDAGGNPDGGSSDAGSADGGPVDGSTADAGGSCREDADCPGGTCVVPPDSGDGMCVSACACESGEVCVAGGRCASSTACDATSCVAGPIEPMRVWAGDRDAQVTDLHIAAKASGPGWALFWVDQTETVLYATADRGPCVEPGAQIAQCDEGTTLVSARRLDARTLPYASDMARHRTYVAVGNLDTNAFPLFRSWALEERPVGACLVALADSSSPFMRYSDVGGVSIVPITTELPAAETAPPLEVIVQGHRALLDRDALERLNSSSNDTIGGEFTGNVAANYGVTAAAVSVGGLILRNAATPESTPGREVVAAIGPPGAVLSRAEFVVRGSRGPLAGLTCTNPADLATCTPGPDVAGADPDAPFAAYRDASGAVHLVTVHPLGDVPKRLERRALDAAATPEVLLTGEDVRGRIVKVLALDAEAIPYLAGGSPVGGSEVWAVALVVNRAGDEQVEIWTGATRSCGTDG